MKDDIAHKLEARLFVGDVPFDRNLLIKRVINARFDFCVIFMHFVIFQTPL